MLCYLLLGCNCQQCWIIIMLYKHRRLHVPGNWLVRGTVPHFFASLFIIKYGKFFITLHYKCTIFPQTGAFPLREDYLWKDLARDDYFINHSGIP